MAIQFNNWGSYAVRLTADAAAAPGQPTSVAQGDILFLVIEDGATDGTTGLPTVSGGTDTWTQMPNSPQYSSGATRLSVYWSRASQANPTMPNIGGGTNHTFARVARFTGGKTTGNPWNNSEYNQGSNAVADATVPGVTHSTADALAVIFVCNGFNGTSTTRFSNGANADLGSFTEIHNQTDTIGNGGGFWAATGTTSSTFGNTTVSDTFAGHGYISVVLAPAPPPTTFSQPHFRVRTGDTVGLNTDSGWYGSLDANATIDAETIFRIRFEVEADATGSAKQFKLQYRQNGGGWADTPIRTSTATHPVDITLSSQYTNDDATTNLLSGSSATFEAGVGMEDDNLSPSITLISEHTEYEWALKIPISYGEANVQHGRNADGDTFEFRIVESAGTVFGGTYVNPTITLNIPNGLVGGCYSESPSRNGPIKDGNGNLYIFEEYADTSAWPLLLKSTDGGDSWTVCAGGGEPTWSGSKDLESVDVQLASNVLHITSSRGTDTAYHQYNTSSHGTPDTWAIKDERVVDAGTAPPDQKVSIAVRSDGTVIVAYRTNAANDIYYRIRSGAGTWGTPVELDTASSTDFTDVWMVVGASDVTYIFYYDYSNTTLYYKTLSAADSLSGRTSVATGLDTGSSYEKPIFGAIYYDDGGVEVITVGYKAADDTIYTRQLRNNSLQTAQQVSTTTVRNHPTGASSQQAVADLNKSGTTLWCLYADASTADIWKASNAAGAGWGSSTEVLDAVTADFIRGQIFTHSAGNGGATVYGFTYDDGAQGLTGYVHYAEFAISSTTTYTKYSSVDALLRKTKTVFSSVDSLIMARRTLSSSVDSRIVKTFTKNASVDGFILKKTTKNQSIDALSKKTISSVQSLNSLAKKTFSVNHSIDSLRKKTYQINGLIDSLLKKSILANHSLDATGKKTFTVNNSIGSYTKKSLSVNSSIDSLLRKQRTISQSLDALTKKTLSVSASVDLVVKKIAILSSSVDSFIKKATSLTDSVDSFLKKSITRYSSIDSSMLKTIVASHSIDLLTTKRGSVSSTIDSLIKKSGAISSFVDGLRIKTTTSTSSVDASVVKKGTVSHSIDSLRRKSTTILSSVDATNKRALTTSHSVDLRTAITELVYDSAQSAHGGTSARMAAAPQAYSYVEYSDFGTPTKVYTRQYVYLSGQLSNLTRDFYLTAIWQSAGVNLNGLGILTNGSFRLYGDTTTDGGSVPFGQWFRIEMEADTVADTVTAKIFYTKDSTTPDVTLTRPSTDPTSFSIVRFGLSDYHSSLEAPGYPTQLWIDDVAIDFSDWIGRFGLIKHSVDALVSSNVQTYAVNHSVQSLLLERQSAAHSIDSLLSKSIKINHGIDSLNKKSQPISSSVDSVKKKIFIATSSIDVLLSKTRSAAYSTDSLLSKSAKVNHSIDSLAKKTKTTTSSEDSVLKKSLAISESVISLLRKALTVTASVDSLAGKPITVSTSVNSLLKKSLVVSQSVVALLRKVLTTTSSIDSIVKKSFTASQSMNSLLRKALIVTSTVDSLSRKALTTTSNVDALLRKALVKTTTVDSLVKKPYYLGAGVDSLIRKSKTVSSSVDSSAKKGSLVQHQIGSYLTKSIRISNSIDALISKRGSVSGSVDSVLKKSISANSSVDSLKKKTLTVSHSVDSFTSTGRLISSSVASYIKSIVAMSYGVDAYLVRIGTINSSLDAFLKKTTYTQSFVDSLIYEIAILRPDSDIVLDGWTDEWGGIVDIYKSIDDGVDI